MPDRARGSRERSPQLNVGSEKTSWKGVRIDSSSFAMCVRVCMCMYVAGKVVASHLSMFQ